MNDEERYTDVSVEHTADGSTLRFERPYACGIERLWRALTDNSEFSIWSPWQVRIEPTVGGRITLAFPDEEPEEGTVIASDPPYLLAFELAGATLRWQLRAAGDHCVLVFTSPVEDPAHIGQSAAGYRIALDHLADHLAGRPVRRAASPPEEPRFAALSEEYKDLL